MPELGNTPAQIAEYIKSRLDASDSRTKSAIARLDELEQKTDRPGSYIPAAPPSAGRQFVECDEVKSFIGNAATGRRIGMQMKATITSAMTDADGSAGDLLIATRDTTLTMPRRRMTVRNLLPVVQVGGNSVEYPKITGMTNNAATVAEGALKPQSEMKVDLVNVPIRTIAHWMLASRQILDDAPQLQGIIDTELRYGLQYVEDNQLLNGAGTGTDINGIYTQATAFAAGTSVVVTPQKIDVIRYAMLQGALAELPPTGVVLNPIDWAGIETLKDGEGRYLIGNPQGAIQPTLWGLPVVATQAMTAGNFLTGAFRMGAQIFDREDANVAVSTEDSDNFRKNLVTILAEERLALAVYRPEAFIKGTFSTAITDLTS